MHASLARQLSHTLRETHLPSLGAPYQGKVRDVYELAGGRLLIVATDRLSAFDRILTTLPFKGELLSRLAVFWFEKTRDVFANHLLDVPDPNAMVCSACRPLPVEVVVRGYAAGSLWRDHVAGRAEAAYGIRLPSSLKKDEKLPAPIVTPSTKAPKGEHDLPVSEAEILARGLVGRKVWEEVTEAARALFSAGAAWAAARGLILVDTKYEFGLAGGRLLLIDEIHTPDSSRFWEAEGYERRFAAGEEQRMLDKENLRQWLLARGFSGHGDPPEIPDEVRVDLASKYVTAFERITGGAFEASPGDPVPRIERNLRARGIFGKG